jgi:hypothetical protein
MEESRFNAIAVGSNSTHNHVTLESALVKKKSFYSTPGDALVYDSLVTVCSGS